jgi:hypothetical protein
VISIVSLRGWRGLRFGLFRDRLAGDAVRAVNPPGEILELAALAAEWLPGRLRGLPAAEHTQGSHGAPLYYGFRGFRRFWRFRVPQVRIGVPRGPNPLNLLNLLNPVNP